MRIVTERQGEAYISEGGDFCGKGKCKTKTSVNEGESERALQLPKKFANELNQRDCSTNHNAVTAIRIDVDQAISTQIRKATSLNTFFEEVVCRFSPVRAYP